MCFVHHLLLDLVFVKKGQNENRHRIFRCWMNLGKGWGFSGIPSLVLLSEPLAGGEKLVAGAGTFAKPVAMLGWPSTTERYKFILPLLLISVQVVSF